MNNIYTVDLETDPFRNGRTPKAFVAGLFACGQFTHFWGNDCVAQLMSALSMLPTGIVYVHNGGRFDLFVRDKKGNSILQHIRQSHEIMVIGNRVVVCDIEGVDGYHSFRDSFALMPFPLAAYKKDDIDIYKMEPNVREKHKDEIVKYLEGDCVYLHELCSDFAQRFGVSITIGSTAMRELKKLHDFECITQEEDDQLRGAFYYGGRVECFESGVLTPSKGSQFVVYDINQSYPNAMKNYDHPIGREIYRGNSIDESCFFLTVEGINNGAFLTKDETGALRFNQKRGTFDVSIHEYNAAIETGKFKLHNIVQTVHFDQWGRFNTFVDKFHGLRKQAQLDGDERGSLFYKNVCNSASGKFAQDPENYYEYAITACDKTPDAGTWYDKSTKKRSNKKWEVDTIEQDEFILWKRKSMNDTRYNVATGASITGAARAALIRALATATRPVYCDTDSIICEALNGVEFSDTKLGAWKVEKSGNLLCVAGKKLYALMNTNEMCICERDKVGRIIKVSKKCKHHVKHASKGTRITPEEIMRVASGEEVLSINDAPTFDLATGNTKFVERRVNKTAR
jgi:DNA polymerase type B, organellar and viral